MACVDCGAGFHFACKESPCCCKQDNWHSEPIEEDVHGLQFLYEDSKNEHKTYKRDSKLKDQQSTGRKRAAARYPLDEESPCEWRGLRFAGGGTNPIVGCTSGLQQARHHGPDKNTLNNDEGNVHRICHKCHNRWHTKNDPGYEWGSTYKPHDDLTKATLDELADSELYWSGHKTVKARD